MITRKLYVEKMREGVDLLGLKIKRDTAEAIYQKIKDEFEDEDFEKAMDEIFSSGGNLLHPYPTLITKLRKYALERRERESRMAKEREEREARRFWERDRSRKYDDCERKCGVCTVKYCDVIASRCIQAMRDLVYKKKTLRQVNDELAKEFPDLMFGESCL